MSPRRLTLQARLLVLQVAVFGGLVLLAGAATYLVLSRALHHDRDAYLASLAATSAADWQSRLSPRPGGGAPLPSPCLPDPVRPDAATPGATHRPRHLLVWDGAMVVCSDGELAPLSPDAADRALATGLPVYADVRWSAEVLRLLEWPFVDGDGTPMVMEVGTSFMVIERVLRQGLPITALIVIGALLSLLLGSALLTRRAFVPIDQIVHTVERIDDANLAERLPAEPTGDQAGRLVAVINRMLDRLERAFVAQSRFASDVAHEIRSPLTALRGQIEVTLRRERSVSEYRQVLTDSLEEVLRLSRLAEDLMSLARADAGVLQVQMSRVELRQLLLAAIDRVQGRATAKNVSIRLVALETPAIPGDPDLLARMVENLLDNAVIHSPQLEEVTVTLATRPKTVTVSVSDHGPGIALEHLPRIFDRFYRADPARSRDSGGAGLGLSIVRQIVTLHGGDVEVTSEVGHGSVFTVALPAGSSFPRLKPPSTNMKKT